MTVTINIGPEWEIELLEEAAKQGLNPDGFVLNTVKDRLHQSRSAVPHLSRAETALLETINHRWSAEVQTRFERLVARRRANRSQRRNSRNLLP